MRMNMMRGKSFAEAHHLAQKKIVAIFMSVFLTYFLLVGKKGGMVFMFDF